MVECELLDFSRDGLTLDEMWIRWFVVAADQFAIAREGGGTVDGEL
jgi:hypothetical protein